MDWMNILSTVLQAVLIVLLPPLAAGAARWLWAQAALLWARVKDYSPSTAELLELAAREAVLAAEQAGAGKLITDKKDYAMAIAEKYLALYGVTVDLDLVSAAIEAAVLREINSGDKPQIGFAG